ncbi:hypothetical protein ACJX0J_027293, partial [Zea mays]
GYCFTLKIAKWTTSLGKMAWLREKWQYTFYRKNCKTTGSWGGGGGGGGGNGRVLSYNKNYKIVAFTGQNTHNLYESTTSHSCDDSGSEINIPTDLDPPRFVLHSHFLIHRVILNIEIKFFLYITYRHLLLMGATHLLVFVLLKVGVLSRFHLHLGHFW